MKGMFDQFEETQLLKERLNIENYLSSSISKKEGVSAVQVV